MRFWSTAAAGWAVMGYGLRGVFQHRVDTRPAELARFVAGGLVVHDVVLVPLALVVGALVVRVVPPRLRAVVQAALIVSGCVALFAYPLVRGYAHAAGNPSSLPHDYAANVAVVLTGVWAVSATLGLVGVLRSRRRVARDAVTRRPEPPPARAEPQGGRVGDGCE